MSTKEKLIELREDRFLFARMMMVYISRPAIDIKETIELDEFSLVSRSMFEADGSMLKCFAESALMAILEEFPSRWRSPDQRNGDSTTTDVTGLDLKVNIIDTMGELQCLGKPDRIKCCAQLADHFVNTIEQTYGRKDEVRLIFDQ